MNKGIIAAMVVAAGATAAFFVIMRGVEGPAQKLPQPQPTPQEDPALKAVREDVRKLKAVLATLQSKKATIQEKNEARQQLGSLPKELGMKGAAAVPELNKLYGESKSAFERRNVVVAVNETECKEAVPVIETALRDPEPAVRTEALLGVKRFALNPKKLIAKEKAMGLVLEATRDSDPAVVKNAVWCLLPFASDKAALQRLEELKAHPSPEVQKAAKEVGEKAGL